MARSRRFYNSISHARMNWCGTARIRVSAFPLNKSRLQLGSKVAAFGWSRYPQPQRVAFALGSHDPVTLEQSHERLDVIQRKYPADPPRP